MKKLKNRIKNNIMYYWSVIGLAVTGSACHIIHYVKTRRLPPKKPKYSQEELREELRKIAKEVEKEETPVEGPEPGE